MEKKQIPLVLHDPDPRVRLGRGSGGTHGFGGLGITRSAGRSLSLWSIAVSHFFLSGLKPSFLKGPGGGSGAAAGEIHQGLTGNNLLLSETKKHKVAVCLYFRSAYRKLCSLFNSEYLQKPFLIHVKFVP